MGKNVRPERDRKQHYSAAASLATRTLAQWMGNATHEHGTCLLRRPQHEDNDMGRPQTAIVIGSKCSTIQTRLQAEAHLLPFPASSEDIERTVPCQGPTFSHLRGQLRRDHETIA